MIRKHRVVLMGTPEFAVPSLRRLARDPAYELVMVVTQPDRPQGRMRKLTPSPVKRAALEYGIPVFQPGQVRATEALEHLRGFTPDVLVTAAYGQLLPQALLDLAPHGSLNLHASLLPRWRGAAPIHRAIMAGDEETGVTLMKMVKALDAGPVLAARSAAILPSDDVGTLHEKLAEVGAELLQDVLPRYLAGEVTAVDQPDVGITYAERIQREDEFIRWNVPAREVHNHIRGLSPWPGAVTLWNGQPLKVWATSVVAVGPWPAAAPGSVARTDDGGAVVRCRDGWLRLQTVQPSGKKRLAVDEWLRGVSVPDLKFAEVVTNE